MPRLTECLLQIANGLQYLHSKNVAHGDVRPCNILIKIDESAVLKLVDFGIRKRDDSFLMSDRIKGALYWSPGEHLELLNQQGGARVTPTFQADIFSLGCVCFYLVSRGQHPFGPTTSILHNIVGGNPVNMKQGM